MAKRRKKIKFFYDDELDLHGYTREEAISELEEFVFSSSGSTLLIIHGKGSGVLKHAVRAFVRKCEYIKSYDFGEDLNLPGGDGLTVVHT